MNPLDVILWAAAIALAVAMLALSAWVVASVWEAIQQDRRRRR